MGMGEEEHKLGDGVAVDGAKGLLSDVECEVLAHGGETDAWGRMERHGVVGDVLHIARAA